MTVENERDLQALLRIGQICGMTLQHMLHQVEPGMTTAQLDAIGAEMFKQHSARSAPILAYKFPGHTCISINDEVAHGIPGDRVIQPGDMINIDVSAELEGYWADCGASMVVPPSQPKLDRLCEFGRRALKVGIEAAKAGKPINDIGKAVEKVARKGGYAIIPELGGHGVGRHIHEKPSVPNYNAPQARQPLTEGLVITIEPFINTGKGRIFTAPDKWTLKTVDGSLTAQYEHTLVIRGDDPVIVTAVQ